MTNRLSNGEWSVHWKCPHCGQEQDDSVHPTAGPFFSCVCGTCGTWFSNDQLDAESLASWEAARSKAEAAAPCADA